MTAIAPSTVPIQQGSTIFNFPVASDQAQAMGGILNALLAIAVPVGTIIDTFLDPNTMQAELGSPFPYTWVLADGSSTITSISNSPSYSVALSAYATETGFTSVPDLRGVFRRGKNNGRSDGNQNPAGDLPLGTYESDQFGPHTHTYSQARPFVTVGGGTAQSPAFPEGNAQTSVTGNQNSVGYVFTFASGVFVNATQGAIYTDGTNQYIVTVTAVSSPTLTVYSLNQATLTSGTLTLVTGTGDPTIAYTGATTIPSPYSETAPKNMLVNSYIRIN